MHVLVHGGAGGHPDDPEARQAVLDDAATAGVETDAPVEAVVRAVEPLEASPRFNAGTGSAVQSDGRIRTDAGMMTDDRSVGAACSMAGVEHAVRVARVVMTETPHCLVSGDRAVALARAFGVPTDVDLWTERTRERWADADPPGGGTREQLAWLRGRFGADDAGDGRERSGSDAALGDPSDHDTVGAVARDGGRFAAATSTGGRWYALAGRVGDVPQVGSGFYAAPAGAASATGAGEDIARVTLARRAVDHLEEGADAATAADRAIGEFAELTGSEAGLIVAGPDTVGTAYNSDLMQTAAASDR